MKFMRVLGTQVVPKRNYNGAQGLQRDQAILRNAGTLSSKFASSRYI